MITVYHNPRCSKSREALAIAEACATQRGEALEIVDYINRPLSRDQLSALQRLLGVGLREMVRDNEPEFAELGLAGASDEQLLDALVRHPRLLQRPVVTCGAGAVIGRPPARVAELLQTG